MKNTVLDDEERELLESYERGEWQPTADKLREVNKLKAYAQNTLRSDQKINILISSKDLSKVQLLAAQEGIPHETLIASIIHKYVSGYLVEKERV